MTSDILGWTNLTNAKFFMLIQRRKTQIINQWWRGVNPYLDTVARSSYSPRSLPYPETKQWRGICNNESHPPNIKHPHSMVPTVWKYPTKPWFRLGVFNLRGKGLWTSFISIHSNALKSHPVDFKWWQGMSPLMIHFYDQWWALCFTLMSLNNLSSFGSVSKPWYLVNIKIAGKWMFIPLMVLPSGELT